MDMQKKKGRCSLVKDAREGTTGDLRVETNATLTARGRNMIINYKRRECLERRGENGDWLLIVLRNSSNICQCHTLIKRESKDGKPMSLACEDSWSYW
jgi:hypothetical protein